MLGDGVWEATGNDVGRVHRGDVDNVADTALHHVRQGRLATEPDAVQVDGEAASPVFLGHLQRVTEHVDPCAVDQHIDLAVVLQRQTDQRLQLGRLGDVGSQRAHLTAPLAPAGGDPLGLVALNVSDDHLGLLRLEAGHDGLANALGAAGDDHDFAFQALAALGFWCWGQ